MPATSAAQGASAPTREDLAAATKVLHAVMETIREAGEAGAPCGVLYSALLGRVDLQGYQAIERVCLGTGLVAKRGDVLYWTGEAR